MGVDTHAFIKSNSDDIYKFIQKNFDSSATMEVNIFGRDDPDERKMYTINFKFGDEQRMMYVHDMQFGGIYVEKEEEWYFKKYQTREESSSYLYHKEGIPDNTPGVICSLRLWGSGILIMDLLSVEFGGWIDENDCDDKGFRKGASKRKKKELVDYIFTQYKYKE